MGIEEDGLPEQLLRSVSMCYPSENQRQLIENIVLCGGTSAMTGKGNLLLLQTNDYTIETDVRGPVMFELGVEVKPSTASAFIDISRWYSSIMVLSVSA